MSLLMRVETYNFDQIDKNIYLLVLISSKYAISQKSICNHESLKKNDEFYFEQTNILMSIQHENQF